MASGAPPIPFIDLGKNTKDTGVWNQLCRRVRDGLERHGCLVIRYDELPECLCSSLISDMPALFGLPTATKRRNVSPDDRFDTYVEPSDILPLYEAIAVINSGDPQNARAFTELMWPAVDDIFCQTQHTVSLKMLELSKIVMDMVCDSYRVGRCSNPYPGNVDIAFRMIQYSAPMSDEPASGLVPHVDGSFLTVLCQNEVDGLLLRSREGDWIRLSPTKGSVVVLVGEALQAWSNGRLVAPLHKVMMSGYKDRLSLALFSVPKKGLIIQSPWQLIDQ